MKNITIGFIIGVGISLLIWNHLAGSEKKATTTNTVTVIKYDSSWYHTAGMPKVLDSVFVPVPADVDTAAILKKYFTLYSFRDSIADSNIVAVIRDSISQNEIVARSFSYQIKRPQAFQTIVNTTLENTRKNSLYVGAFASMKTYGPQLLYCRNKAAYGINYDILSKSLSLQLSWKILR